jgi:hypothetical protein
LVLNSKTKFLGPHFMTPSAHYSIASFSRLSWQEDEQAMAGKFPTASRLFFSPPTNRK